MDEKKTSKRDLWMTVLFALLFFMGLGIVALGTYLGATQKQFEVLAIGVLCLIIPSAIYPILASGRTTTTDNANSEQLQLLQSINDRLLLTDNAKQVAYREKNRNSLRVAIEEDIRIGDYDAALILVDQMANTFGYREEAENFRQTILSAQQQRREEMVEESLKRVEQLCASYEWDDATMTAERLSRLYPDHQKTQSLTNYVQQCRNDRKRDLERQFLRASEIEDVEKAMELLTDLDRYLSASEAEPYKETARGVIGKKRDNLGVRFKMAVHDREWIEAVTVGETIIRDFPNTRMADEVRDMIDLLRERSAGQKAADQTISF